MKVPEIIRIVESSARVIECSPCSDRSFDANSFLSMCCGGLSYAAKSGDRHAIALHNAFATALGRKDWCDEINAAQPGFAKAQGVAS